MRVFVTGGTGAIGRHTVPALVAAGHEVHALVRRDDAARQIEAFGAHPVRVSLFDMTGLATSFAGCGAVVNLASALPSSASFVRRAAWRDCQRIRSEGSAAVVSAASAAGVPVVLQESVVMLHSDGGDRWIDERSDLDHYPIAEGNHAAEASARRFSESGGRGIVLRFGLFYGPGATHSEQFLAAARRGVAVTMGPPENYVSSIHVADGGAAVVAALDAPAGVYEVVDDEPVTRRHYADALSDAVGTRAWIHGPGRLALLLGERTTSLTRSLRVRNTALRETTGWAPRYPSVREGYAEMALIPR